MARAKPYDVAWQWQLRGLIRSGCSALVVLSEPLNAGTAREKRRSAAGDVGRNFRRMPRTFAARYDRSGRFATYRTGSLNVGKKASPGIENTSAHRIRCRNCRSAFVFYDNVSKTAP